MPTTAKVYKKTLQMLNKIKKEMKAKSYDEVIKKLILKDRKIPYLMFRSNRKLISLSAAGEAEFHKL